MRCLRFSLFAIASVFLLCSTLIGQTPENRPRITARVDEGALITLPGNTHPSARAEFDRGPVDSELVMGDLFLVLRRSPSRQKAFDDFVAGQYDSSSPNFHHWLTPVEIGARFGPSLTDIETISAWLRSHGLSVDEVSPDRMSIRFSGTAGQVDATFRTPIHNLMVKGQPHIGNMSDPQIPAALAPVVVGVKALHNFLPHPLSRVGSPVRLNPETGKWERIAPAAAPGANSAAKANLGTVARPLYGTTTNGSVEEDVTPFDWATIYNVLPLWNASTPIDGTGQKIVIAGTSNINLSDVATFRSTFGLPAKAPQVIITNTDPGTCGSTPLSTCTLDQVENSLDVEWSGAIAKGAQIILVTSSKTTTTTDPLFASAKYIVDHAVAPVESVSYGLCELGLGTGGNTQWANLWRTAAAAGISVFVATGDSGSPACDQGGDAQFGTPYLAEFGLTVNGIGSTPDNTAVGGTDLNWGTTAAPYWNATNATNGSSAKGYMPEVPWNNSCTNPLVLSYLQGWGAALRKAGFSTAVDPNDSESACNFVGLWYQTIASNTSPSQDISFLLDTVGAGGGISGCTTSDGLTTTSCAGGYAQPPWQTGVSGIPSGGKRAIPDVSFFASNGFLSSAYLICVTSAGSTCSSPTAFLGIGGTSASTPAMAGVMALINQKLGSPQGNAAPEMYKLAAQQTYSSCATAGPPASTCYFNDITSGTISMPCDNGLTGTTNSPDCHVSVAADTVGILTGYAATPAFDAATGLGSMNVANAVNAWATFVGSGATTVTVSPTSNTIARTSPLTVAVTVAGSSTLGNPTGTVALSGGGFTSSAQNVAASGTTNATASFTIPASSLTIGSDTLTATYSGDDNYAKQTGTASVTVNGLTPTLTVTPSLTALNSSTALDVTAAVAGTGGTPTGKFTLSGGGYNSGAQIVDNTGKFVFHVPAYSFTAGAVALTVNYSGDTNYNSASKSANVTITVSTFALAATDVTLTAGATSANVSTVTVTPVAGYTGTVTLTAAVTASPTGAVGAPTLTGSSVAITDSTAKIGTVTVATTAAAAVRLATNRGDAWFKAAGGTALAALLFFFLPMGFRRGRRMFSAMLLVVAATFTVVGCGGGGGGGGGGGTQKTTPSVTVSATPSSFSSATATSVAITVSGGTSTATGTVTLSGGGFTSTATTLASGAATISIPANKLTVGTDTLTATYSGDTNFNSATGTTSVTVKTPGTTTGAYTVTVTGTGSDAAHTAATTTFTLTVN